MNVLWDDTEKRLKRVRAGRGLATLATIHSVPRLIESLGAANEEEARERLLRLIEGTPDPAGAILRCAFNTDKQKADLVRRRELFTNDNEKRKIAGSVATFERLERRAVFSLAKTIADAHLARLRDEPTNRDHSGVEFFADGGVLHRMTFGYEDGNNLNLHYLGPAPDRFPKSAGLVEVTARGGNPGLFLRIYASPTRGHSIVEVHSERQDWVYEFTLATKFRFAFYNSTLEFFRLPGWVWGRGKIEVQSAGSITTTSLRPIAEWDYFLDMDPMPFSTDEWIGILLLTLEEDLQDYGGGSLRKRR